MRRDEDALSKQAERIVLCVIRTLGALLLVVILILGAKHLQIDKEDAAEVLKIFKEYFPSLLAVIMFAAVGVTFYRASVNLPDFNFIYFFITKPGVHEDVGKLVYFLLGLTVLWSYFALHWDGRLETTYVVGTLTVFIVQGIASIAGKVLGKPREPDPPPKLGEPTVRR